MVETERADGKTEVMMGHDTRTPSKALLLFRLAVVVVVLHTAASAYSSQSHAQRQTNNR